MPIWGKALVVPVKQAMVPPTIYDLDADPANSNWMLTNSLPIVLVPALYFAVQAV